MTVTAPADWKLRLERFFYDRAAVIEGIPSLFDHCMVSAKDPRISARPDLHADVIDSIMSALAAHAGSNVLEVGCASGYIACGIAPRVGRYTGIDLAAAPLEVARKMKLANAVFRQGDGGALPYADGSFDAAFAYDVYTNFPTFEDGVPLIRDMLRVVRPGGRVLIGSVTNKKKAADFEARVREVAARLEAEQGPVPLPPPPSYGLRDRLRDLWLRRSPPAAAPEIIVYYFDPDDFGRFAKDAGVGLSISDVHKLNPYFGFRYNVVLTKPAA